MSFLPPPVAPEKLPLWRVEQYRGQSAIRVEATQLDHRVTDARQRRRILDEWIEFFATTVTALVSIDLASRVPQELLDSIAGQPQLEQLDVKWGPYVDLSAVGSLDRIQKLSLGGATRVVDLSPLLQLPHLTSLHVEQAYRFDRFHILGEFTSLRRLGFSGSITSAKNVVVPDLTWARSLSMLESLELPGTRIVEPDLSPLLALPKLRHLTLPLRRTYRRQVFEFAQISPAFAKLAADYDASDPMVEADHVTC